MKENGISDVEAQPLQQNNHKNNNKKPTKIREQLIAIRNRYKSSFTVHALNHIVDGTLPEKLLWSVKLLAAIAVAVYLCWNLFVDYFTYKTTSNVRIVMLNEMFAPTVFLCTKDYKRYRRTFNDCSSNTTRSYNLAVCSCVNRGCPGMFVNEHVPDEACPPQLLGQCVGFNTNGTMTISHSTYMYFEKHVNVSALPLTVYVALPGSLSPMGSFHDVEITQGGEYLFDLDKTTFKRLPRPYSNPSCIVEGSPESRERNIFRTAYRIESCRSTCYVEWYLRKCGVIKNEHRIDLRDESTIAHRLNHELNESAITECIHEADYERNLGESWVEHCVNNCPLPCEETKYDVKLTRKEYPEPNIAFSFDFRYLKEFQIEENPSFDIQTLIGTFGGTLGLMTGMSALSVFELLVWVVLFVGDRVYSLHRRYIATNR